MIVNVCMYMYVHSYICVCNDNISYIFMKLHSGFQIFLEYVCKESIPRGLSGQSLGLEISRMFIARIIVEKDIYQSKFEALLKLCPDTSQEWEDDDTTSDRSLDRRFGHASQDGRVAKYSGSYLVFLNCLCLLPIAYF
jgi:hypothetical protein